MKIKTTNEAFFGLTMKVPVDGAITLDSEGCFEASEEAAESLMRTGQWISAEAVKTNKKQPTKKVVVEEEIVDEGGKVEDEDSETTEELVEVVEEQEDEDVETFEEGGLETLGIEELKQVCTEAGFPESEWKAYKKSKKMMINYINKKQTEGQ